MRELHILSLKMDDTCEIINIFTRSKRNEVQDSSTHDEIPENIIKLFPVNENSLFQLENWLEKPEHKKILVRF